MLRKLASTGTFMETDAHPDDEDNALLAMLGHGQGMRTALVTATRGDGGQNEIGPELFQALGVLRTEELLAVHRFDGAEQYFTRAVDFGFSFSIEESIEKWGHDEIVGDFVRHIRTHPPRRHRRLPLRRRGRRAAPSGLRAADASKRSAPRRIRRKYPEQITEGLRPWQAHACLLHRHDQLRPQAIRRRTPDLLTVGRDRVRSVLGRTYSELGLEARSMHKCQGTSQLLLLPGPVAQPDLSPARQRHRPAGRRADATVRRDRHHAAGLARFAGAQPPDA